MKKREADGHMGSEISRVYYWKFNVAAGSFLFIALFYQLMVRVNIINISYRIEHVREEALARDIELRDIDSQISAITVPHALRARASRDLGLSPLQRQQVRGVAEDERSGGVSDLARRSTEKAIQDRVIPNQVISKQVGSTRKMSDDVFTDRTLEMQSKLAKPESADDRNDA